MRRRKWNNRKLALTLAAALAVQGGALAVLVSAETGTEPAASAGAYLKATNEPYCLSYLYDEYGPEREYLTMYADEAMELELAGYEPQGTVKWEISGWTDAQLWDSETEESDPKDLKKCLGMDRDAIPSGGYQTFELDLYDETDEGKTLILTYGVYAGPYTESFYQPLCDDYFCVGSTAIGWEVSKEYSDAWHPLIADYERYIIEPASISAADPDIASFSYSTEDGGRWEMACLKPGTTTVTANYVWTGEQPESFTRTYQVTIADHEWEDWTVWEEDPTKEIRECVRCCERETRNVQSAPTPTPEPTPTPAPESTSTPAPEQTSASSAAEEPALMISGLPNGKAQWDGKTIVLSVKQSITLTMQGDPAVSWTSSNKKAASVTNKGKVKAKAAGTTTLTAALSGGDTVSVKVKIQKGAVTTKKITVDAPKKISLKRGETYNLKTSLTPVTTVDKVKYSSSNKKAAAVSAKGMIQAKKKGTAIVTVESGKKKVKIKVNVK